MIDNLKSPKQLFFFLDLKPRSPIHNSFWHWCIYDEWLIYLTYYHIIIYHESSVCLITILVELWSWIFFYFLMHHEFIFV